ELEHDNIEGTRHISAMLEKGRGGLGLSAHLGNWEVAGHLLKHLPGPIHILMYDGEEAGVKAALSNYQQQRSFQIIYVKEDLSHIYEIMAALGRNELVCLHGDRFLPGHRTLSAPFLGEESPFPAGPFLLA